MARRRVTRETSKKVASDLAKVQFVAALAAGASVLLAAQEVCISRATAYRWRDDDESFADAWDDALDEGTDRLEQEAIRRGRDGVEKPVYHRGKVVGRVQEYSDTLLIFMLKARRPDVYRERASFEHTGKDGKDLPGPVAPTGVLVVPGVIEDPKAWTAMVQKQAEHRAAATATSGGA